MVSPSRRGPTSARGRKRPSAAPAAADARPAHEATFPVSVEALLWTALVATALSLRFASLDELPLTVGESSRAFSAWLVSNGSVPEGWPGDATAALTSHLFRIFGSGETVARIVPAVAGSALVASFALAGRYFGRGVALLAGAFIALSPLAVHTSRSASGFALGGLLSMVMVLSLLAYLEQRRPLPVIAFAASFGLALASDPIATSTAVALVAFLSVEATWRGGGAVGEAITAFRSTGEHWRPAAVALAATLLLGVVQFGTDIDRLGLAGLRQWADMFGLPRDDLPWHYQLSVLAGYEWPVLLAGAAGSLAVAGRWLRGQEPPLTQRLLLAWLTIGVLVVGFATRRESGQVLLLLLPLSLLAATWIEEVISRIDWGGLKRWWPALALALSLTAYALLQLSRWAREGGVLTGGEKASVVLALVGVAAVLLAGFHYAGQNGLSLALPFAAALALPFLVHSSISLGVGDGTEFAADPRLAPGVEPFRAALAQAAEEKGLPVAVAPRFRDDLGWPLRNSPVLFGDPAEGASIVVAAGEEAPPGYEPVGRPWRVSEGWAPENFDPLPTWRWFAYRQPYGNLSSIEVQIMEPSP